MKSIIAFSVLFALTQFACNLRPACEYSHIQGFAQGTTYNITFENCDRKDYSMRIDSILKDFDMSLSEYNPNSIVSRINSNDPTVKADEHFKAVFLKSKQIWEQSGGLMDITVGPIIDALGFGPVAKAGVDSAKILQLLKYVGFEKVRLENDRIIKSDTAIKLDVNSIAQGYSVDVVCNFFDSEGIDNYMVEIGGEVHTKGKNPKGLYWRVGIDKPLEGNMVPGETLQAIISLKNQSVTTAGNYRNFYEENGAKYSHIINPKTGFPVKSRLLSVTVVAKDCITADGWDTPLMVMGLEGSIETLKKHPELEALLIYSDEEGNFKEFMTEGFKDMITH
jgi:thiamine biosynthesis lipoprotein